jgi:hypothetical protein
MAGLALLQLQVSVDASWLDYLIIGVNLIFALEIEAILRNRIRSSEAFSLRRVLAELGDGAEVLERRT